MRKLKPIGQVGLLILLGLILVRPVAAQQPELQRHLTRGKLWATFRNTGTQGLRDDSRLGADAGLMYPGWGIGERDFTEYWITGQDNDHRYHTSQAEGFWIFSKDSEGVNTSSSNPRYNSDDIVEVIYDPTSGPEANLGIETVSALTGNNTANYWPGSPPLIADEPIEIHNYDYGRYIPNDNEAEELIISKWTTERGLTVTRKARAWSYTDYDDFIILEVVVENTGDTNGDGVADGNLPIQQDEVYFSFVNNVAPSWAGHRWQNATVPWAYSDVVVLDDWYKYTEASNFNGLASLQGKKMSYVYDGDLLASAGDDSGQPFDPSNSQTAYVNRGALAAGELLGFQYVGLAPLDFDPTDGFTNDTETYVAPASLDQPAHVNWWEIFGRFDFDTPDISNKSESQLFDEFTGQGSVPAVQDNPDRVNRVTFSHTYGPYTLAPGEKAKVVVAWVAGSGAEFAGPGGTPMDVYAWARQGNQSQVTDGERALAVHLDRAQFAYDNNYDVPDAPPDVAVFVDSDKNGNNAITWSDRTDSATDPDYTGAEAQDVAGYHVYRNDNNHLGPWELIADIPIGGTLPAGAEYAGGTPWTSTNLSYSDGGTYTYRDVNSVPGFSYWYSVRAYDTGHTDWNGNGPVPSLEGGHAAPEQRMNVSRSPIVIATAEKDALEDPVRVVPNPFRADPGDDVHRYPPGSNNIRFVNIPSKAKISIFSVSGDLISVINHPQRSTDPDRGEATWDQRTRTFSGRVAAGRYYYVVESLVSGQQGKKQTGMFMIVK
jgi:hypothetical protein